MAAALSEMLVLIHYCAGKLFYTQKGGQNNSPCTRCPPDGGAAVVPVGEWPSVEISLAAPAERVATSCNRQLHLPSVCESVRVCAVCSERRETAPQTTSSGNRKVDLTPLRKSLNKK